MGEEGGRVLGTHHARDLDESLSDHIFADPLGERLIYGLFVSSPANTLNFLT